MREIEVLASIFYMLHWLTRTIGLPLTILRKQSSMAPPPENLLLQVPESAFMN